LWLSDLREISGANVTVSRTHAGFSLCFRIVSTLNRYEAKQGQALFSDTCRKQGFRVLRRSRLRGGCNRHLGWAGGTVTARSHISKPGRMSRPHGLPAGMPSNPLTSIVLGPIPSCIQGDRSTGKVHPLPPVPRHDSHSIPQPLTRPSLPQRLVPLSPSRGVGRASQRGRFERLRSGAGSRPTLMMGSRRSH